MTRVWIRLLIVCCAVALLCLLYPVYVIRPFRHQGPLELILALRVMEWRGMVTKLVLAAAAVCAIYSWRNSIRSLTRIAVAALLLITAAAAGLSSVNLYEQMFHPITGPTFTSAANRKLAPRERVLSVQQNGAARAYPVRVIAYHHLVNDQLAGVPLVATY